ncbi:MAG: hypothetical protein J7L38_02090 [Thermoproteales archaeon]|nr:hypothetical protein [Thermoproteales archaeon]
MSCSHIGCRSPPEILMRIDGYEIPLCKKHFKELQDHLLMKAVLKGKSSLQDVKLERKKRGRIQLILEPSNKEAFEKKIKEISKRYAGIVEGSLGKIEKKQRKRRRRRKSTHSSKSAKKS